MVDGPRDQTRPTRDAAVRAAVGQLAREVMGYLRRHPDFLDEHPEALRLLRPPSRDVGEGIVDFQHFLYERQRRELNRVNLEYRNLITVSRGNLASQNRVHKAALTVLAAPSFGQLLQIVTTDLAVLLDVDVLTIAVENIAGITPLLIVNGIHLLEAGTVEDALGP